MNITETFIITADNTDVMAAPSRLQSIPFAGIMAIEVSATASTAANNATVSLELPNGEVPYIDHAVPYNGYSATDDVLHSESELSVAIPLSREAIGGHVLLTADVTGTVRVFIRVTLTER